MEPRGRLLQARAEVEGRGVEPERRVVTPEVQHVSADAAAVTVEDVAPDVDLEATVTNVRRSGATELARATPVLARRVRWSSSL